MFTTLLYACLATLASSVLEDCAKDTSVFTLTEYNIHPDPPLLDQPVYLTNIFFNPGEPITAGIVLTDITYNGIPLPQTKKSLCETTQCPIDTGSNDRSTMTLWPSDASGKNRQYNALVCCRRANGTLMSQVVIQSSILQ